MQDYDAGSITANEVEIPIQVDESGSWKAEYAGQHLRYDTRDKLKTRLETLTKKTKITVQVPVIRIEEYKGWGTGPLSVARGELTGIHAGTGNVLAAWQVRGKTEKEQITNWGQAGTVYVGGDTTDDQLVEYSGICNKLTELRKRKEAWLKARQIKPQDAVETALKARGGEQD